VSVLEHGYQYLSEVRLAGINDLVERLRDTYLDLDLPLRSIEDEWGPGQLEVTFDPMVGLATADAVVLFRSAAKQIAQQMGCHATFMCRPALPNFFSSGWHLHQSLVARDGSGNAFTERGDGAVFSDVARRFVGGLLEHASAASPFATPTVNGYKRFAPFSFAPDRASWAVENRGAMIRVLGGPGDESTHLENRVGEPCANPYLFMASQIAAGLDGLDRGLDPGAPDPEPYAADRRLLPTGLDEAIVALETEGQVFRDAFGSPFVDFFLSIKKHELGRYRSHVSDWEQREYFEVY
jgi:glutamine synthetase